MSYIQQFFTSRDNNANSETFVGQVGRLWWDPVTNQIYSSDGNTPGGIPLSGGGGNVTPGGSNSQVQFNQAGSFGGSAFLTFNVVTGTLTTVAVSATGNITGGNLSAVNLVINSIRSDDSTFVTIEDGVIVNGVITLENGAIIRDSVDTALAIGFGAGNVTNAQNGALAVGWLAGSEGQGYDAVAIGSSAGGSDGFQGESAIAIGGSAGANLQSPYAVAVGTTAGQFAQGGFSVAIGYGTGLTSQGASAVAIGTGAGNTSQGNATIAVGTGAGSTTQGANAVAIGTGAGTNNQGTSAVAVGGVAGAGGSFSTNYVSGAVSPSTTLVVVDTTNIVPGMIISGTGFTGNQTVVTVTNATTLAISASANSTPSGELTFTGSQGILAVAIGNGAGQVQQGQYAVAIGAIAGNSGQGTTSVAVGYLSGAVTQGTSAVAVGAAAGAQYQGQLSVAVGQSAGYINQGILAVAVGPGAGISGQGSNTVAIGTYAAAQSQGSNAVAIGAYAGNTSQGNSAVAIGAFAGATSQGNNSIILNATAANLDQTTANTFTVAPVRNDVSNIGNVMFYNVTSKEITYGNVISVAGNVTGSYFIGNGSLLSSITGANVTGQVSNALVAGTVYTAAQPNITSVGTLTSLSSSGNIDGGNLNAVRLSLSGNVVSAINSTANIITTGNIRAGNLIGSNLTATRIPFVGTGGVITDSIVMYTDQPNQLLYVGGGGAYIGGTGGFGTVNATRHEGSTMTATGNVTGGNIRTGGQVSATGNITGGNVLGGANVNATTHTGTTVSVTGAITGGSLTVSTGNVTLGNIINANGNSVGNIGSSSVYFDTIFAKATSAQYADLAEKYTADAQYASGTVLSFGGAQEVTVTLTDADHRVAGVVSNNPATIMNAGLTGEHVATVALTGRVPCSVTGTVRKGDSMVSAGNGVARAEANPAVSTVIGKALEDFDGESGVIEVAVGVR